jgi:hypothetical protein
VAATPVVGVAATPVVGVAGVVLMAETVVPGGSARGGRARMPP